MKNFLFEELNKKEQAVQENTEYNKWKADIIIDNLSIEVAIKDVPGFEALLATYDIEFYREDMYPAMRFYRKNYYPAFRLTGLPMQRYYFKNADRERVDEIIKNAGLADRPYEDAKLVLGHELKIVVFVVLVIISVAILFSKI